MNKTFRFDVYGYVDVTTDSLESAQKLLKTWAGHDKVFTDSEIIEGDKKESIFSFQVPTNFREIVEQ